MLWGFGKQNGNRAADSDGGDPAAPSPQGVPNDRWSARLDQIDRYLDATRQKESTPGPAGEPRPTKKRGRWWWIWRGVAAFFVLFVLIVLWLAITAPLSKSLQPIAPPQITLLAADGTPIARNGAVVDKPVEIARLPKHV